MAVLGLVVSLAVASPSVAANPKPGQMDLMPVTNAAYQNYHTGVADLPDSFKNADPGLNYYYYRGLDSVDKAIYCIEIQNHDFGVTPDHSATPNRTLSEDQKKLLGYVMAQGPELLAPSDDAAVRSYSAAQIVVWLITEGLYTDQTVLDAVLFPPTGDFSDTEGFAQTLEIGRLGRDYLTLALDYLAGNIPPVKPSFAGTDKATAPSYNLASASSGGYEVILEDTDGALGLNWRSGRLTATDSAGFDLTVTGNKMKVAAQTPHNGTVTLSHSEPTGNVEYLLDTSYQIDGHYSQETARFIFTGWTATEYYFSLAGDQAAVADPAWITQLVAADDADKMALGDALARTSAITVAPGAKLVDILHAYYPDQTLPGRSMAGWKATWQAYFVPADPSNPPSVIDHTSGQKVYSNARCDAETLFWSSGTPVAVEHTGDFRSPVMQAPSQAGTVMVVETVSDTSTGNPAVVSQGVCGAVSEAAIVTTDPPTPPVTTPPNTPTTSTPPGTTIPPRTTTPPRFSSPPRPGGNLPRTGGGPSGWLISTAVVSLLAGTGLLAYRRRQMRR